ncbi:helix-turn-helix transcriptional regulator [Micromonospora sp. CPCC 206060]|uniref:helix-turn-helix domain-containing protein n=1 Tax=Micromonospora sp. CPCC 206060 TaxID=3122406 RepID=UPI002FF34134
MTMAVGSTVSRRQLGRHLRQLREQAGISQDDAAFALGCSRQKIWRVECGAVPVRPRDVKVLCNLYRAGAETTRVLAALATQTREKAWWREYGDAVPNWFSLYVELEMTARRLRHYNGELVPGLLRTPDYAGAVVDNRPASARPERDQAVSLQLGRQALLTRQVPDPPCFDVVLSEAVLQRRIGDPDGMAAQLTHLVTVSRLPNVSVRILPLSVGPTGASEAGPFTILDFPVSGDRGPIEPTTVYSESLTGARYLTRPSEVAAYEEVWSRLVELALPPDESRDMIGGLVGVGAERG